jgi:gas vesicle protein
MNALEKLILATAAIIYGMTTQLPANETVKEAQDAITKWYEATATAVTKDVTALGKTIETIPDNISAGTTAFVDETIKFQQENWAKGMEQNQQNWEYLKSLVAPKEETKK